MSFDRSITASRIVAETSAHPALAGQPALSHRLGKALRRLWEHYRVVRTERATARALSRLSESQLKDIGVEPGAISQIARAAAWAQLATAGLDGLGGDPFDPRRVRM